MEEFIIFVNDNGTPTGEVGEKYSSHNDTTKKHLAFSLYLFNEKAEVLLTKRASSKKVWPGYWTNSVCGHPMPGELIEKAIQRRAKYEIGITNIHSLSCVIPDFSYVTPQNKGVIENEFCPVYTAVTSEEVCLNPLEVDQSAWIGWEELRHRQNTLPDLFSYWSKLQAKELDNLLVNSRV